MSIRSLEHIALHFAVPLAVACTFYRTRWQRAWLIMISTLIVDLDHLLAVPMYDPNRCSIGFHPLHSSLAIGLYAALLLPRRSRLLGIGLILHMSLDALDCLWMGQSPFDLFDH